MDNEIYMKVIKSSYSVGVYLKKEMYTKFDNCQTYRLLEME